MSYTEYSKELEAFIAKQKRLLQLDKERISSAPPEEQNKQQQQSTPPEESRRPDSGSAITNPSSLRIPSKPSSDKLSKEKVNSQISRKTSVVQEEENAGIRITTSRGQTEAASGPIDSINIDSRQDVGDNPSSMKSPQGASAVLSVDRAKQMSPQQDEMEQWVSDTFFSYFPSFNKKQKEQKTVLSRTRQQEYQEYLKNIPEVTTKHQQYMQKYGTGKPPGTETTNEKGTSPLPPPQPPQVRFGKSLVAEANANFRKDTIDRRNRMLADEESRRKMEYQKELIKQIEEKRKEVERLREKEKLEEEMLTSRLEQQLKTMQLEEQLEHERLRSEKIRIATEQNHIRRLQLLANLENDHKLFNPYDGQRKAFSENGVKVVKAPGAGTSVPPGPSQHPNGSYSSGDERTKVYRYFSNSAQQQQQQQEKHNHFVSVGVASSSALSSEQDYESSSETTNNSLPAADHRYQYCKSCRADIDRSFLPPTVGPRDHSKRQHCAKCGCKRTTGPMHGSSKKKHAEDHTFRCIKCDRSMKRPAGLGNGLAALCAVCTLTTDADKKNQVHHKKLHQDRRSHSKARHHSTLLDEDDDDDEAVRVHQAPPISPKHNPYKILDIQYHESEGDNGDLDVLNPVIVRNNYRKPPYSLNIEKDSLFHPSRKTPEPVLSVNIRNGEVFVDNKIRTGGGGGGAGGAARPPASPSDADEGHRDDETSTATVGDDMLDERIAKYVRHYNTLWMKRGNNDGGGRKSNGHYHSHHQQHDGMKGGKSATSGTLLPSLSPPKVYVSDRPDNLKSDGLKLVEKKWEIPAVERTKVNEKGSTRVLTQLGAIRKQLQLEQLQMDDPSTYSKKY
ncbi:uncharacterized protein LOC118511425 isoform X2 [Anopheles stephensi]|uniref:uncharacterized protein LOC118511425 isoform X2 n=1 Tax=Anopheles stephensi TaxID=30069 RepID=UPI001658C238|nr:uncharacterized protein LOC118511425 isoform X2 [Anopheles stephensi]